MRLLQNAGKLSEICENSIQKSSKIMQNMRFKCQASRPEGILFMHLGFTFEDMWLQSSLCPLLIKASLYQLIYPAIESGIAKNGIVKKNLTKRLAALLDSYSQFPRLPKDITMNNIALFAIVQIAFNWYRKGHYNDGEFLIEIESSFAKEVKSWRN